MVVYNFKKITQVPTAKDFVDIILSKTQRKTPTVVHKGYSIQRIRSFYIRKVKFTSQSYHDKLTIILDEFPVLDDIHPFYADLINVLYDRDHYKLALGQLNAARSLIDNLGKEYLRLLKYGDSLYRCKTLKRAALGRMCTIMKKQGPALAFLEQVRQHLARLPAINPSDRTLIVCGYPNVGKSSLMNKLTRANVDVQPYAFTTKSLFVGHMDYRYVRWQVIDTPGVLDHPLPEMNTIEMQSITALLHLKAAVVYVMDLSEQCGYSIAQQVALFNSIKPLFAAKPLLVALNKVDLVRPTDLTPDHRAAIESMGGDGVEFVPMSTRTEEGVTQVKQNACDRLLSQRVEAKLAAHAKSATSGATLINRLRVATPKPRDDKERSAFVPDSVLAVRSGAVARPAVSELRADHNFFHPDSTATDPTKHGIDWRKDYLLKNEDWKFDVIPEILDGHNIADYVDPEIEARLAELEAEEEERIKLVEGEMDDDDFDVDDLEEIEEMKSEKKLAALESISRRQRNGTAPLARDRRKTVEGLEAHLEGMGIDSTRAVQNARSRSTERGRKRTRSSSANPGEDATMGEVHLAKMAHRSVTPGRDIAGVPERARVRAQSLARKAEYGRNKNARKGEADRHVSVAKPKHLFSGKRGIGSNDRR